jgi:hypothetical protein
MKTEFKKSFTKDLRNHTNNRALLDRVVYGKGDVGSKATYGGQKHPLSILCYFR